MSWHRRKLAALSAVAAVLTGLTALAPPAPATVQVVRVRSALPGGAVLSSGDLRLDRLPPEALPSGALTDLLAPVGKTLSGRVAKDQILAHANLVEGRMALPGGHVVAPLRLADASVSTMLTEGTVVDVLAAENSSGAAEIVASGVRVIAVPPPPEDGSAAVDGLLVLVEVDRQTARALAQAAVVARLSVVWR